MGLRRLTTRSAFSALVIAVALISCNCGESEKTKKSNNLVVKPTSVQVPDNMPFFEPDSAFAFVKKQVDFGPRIPNTKAHKACGEWLSATLKRLGAEVTEQNGTVNAYNGERLPMKNIIGRINPEVKDRILLFAHWDTRPFSDQDKNNPKGQFDGANDGASGVGVLLEIARVLQKNPLPEWLGIDIIFFDVEDYGDSSVEDSYCLGSQYFGAKVPIKNFSPRYGILLDMVGAPQATFYQEAYSVNNAPQIVSKVWQMADAAGYSAYFINQMMGGIIDDHVYINKALQIPCIDIIHYDPNTKNGFGSYWHTQDDNIQAIDKYTLKAVGQTVIAVLFSEKLAL